MQIIPVHTPKLLRQFITLPYQIYGENPLWTPPLRLEQKKMFTRSKNIVLQKCPHQLYIVKQDDTCLARAAVYIDDHYNDYWQEETGFFGSFECVYDDRVAKALLATCEKWLSEHGCKSIRGPINFESQNWGFVCDGFNFSSRIMAPFNPPYYNDLVVNCGFVKAKDLDVYGAHVADYEIPERFKRHKERLIQKYHLTVRSIRMNKLVDDVRIILDLNNRSVAGNWGVAPVSLDEAEKIARDLKTIVRPDLILIIEAQGEPIAFLIVLPEIYTAMKDLKGRLFPFGLLRLMTRLKKISEFRFWALGVVPEYQRRGIDSLLYLTIYEILHKQDVYVEANYILEDNFAMKDAVLKLGMQKVRTYRVYEKQISAPEG
ncbi:hypothetical protein EH223_04770 [candidate division KSB1 bacterium]|nr:hypothetical protein [candidate division KSB1 bacterium]RQW05592.1 MAG: hypothetical protein EH223_04770 [candidate division KSB1 bacterium]